VKNAFVKDDSENANKEAIVLLNKLSQVDIKLLNEPSAHNQWKLLEKDLKTSAHSISATIDIEEQRMQFKQLSLYLTNAIHIFGINEKVYSIFCPMVDNNKGAYWLSAQTEVINPYYGKEMLDCGEVREIIE
jgi:Cu(I)/Ag(I) efflux system membrane fusion protein